MERAIVTVCLLCTVALLSIVSCSSSKQDGDSGCELRDDPEALKCISRLEADLKSRRLSDPDEVSCCLVARLEDCLAQALQGRCNDEVGDELSHFWRKIKVAIDCDSTTFPSLHCYAYLYRDLVSLALVATLITFACYAVVLCCRTCCLACCGRRYHYAGALRATNFEQRPLIIVTQHHSSS